MTKSCGLMVERFLVPKKCLGRMGVESWPNVRTNDLREEESMELMGFLDTQQEAEET